MKPRNALLRFPFLVMFHVGLAVAAFVLWAILGDGWTGIFEEPLVVFTVGVALAAGARGALVLDRRAATTKTMRPAFAGPALLTVMVTVGCLLNWMANARALTLDEFIDWAFKPAFWLLLFGLPLAAGIGLAFGGLVRDPARTAE